MIKVIADGVSGILHSIDYKNKTATVEVDVIYIKGIYSDWKSVDIATAKEYIKILKRGINNLSNSEKNKYINEKRLKGITVEELERWMT